MSRDAEILRGLLDAATALRASEDPIALVVGERVGAIAVDALLELDLDYADHWDDLLAKDPRPDMG